MDTIALRSEGNPFFAEELLAAAGRAGQVPPRLHDLLLQRVAGLDQATRALLRLAAAAGREVTYPLLRALAAQPEGEVRESLRAAVDRGVLVADQAAGTFRFRHALLREAVYATILPGEREELHGRLAEELTRTGAAAGAAELAQHWAAARHAPEALVTSVAAAREAEAVCGLAEARAHIERVLALWARSRTRTNGSGATSGRSARGGPTSRRRRARPIVGWSSRNGRSTSSVGATLVVPPCSTSFSASACTRPAATARASPRSPRPSSSCPRTCVRLSGRTRWAHSPEA